MVEPTVTFEARFIHHKKVAKAITAGGPAAAWLFVKSVCWSTLNLTDGHLSSDQALELASVPQPDGTLFVLTAEARQAIDALVEAGLWDPSDEGFLIHDFADYQLTEAKLDQRRARWRLQKRRQRSPSLHVHADVRADIRNVQADVRRTPPVVQTPLQRSSLVNKPSASVVVQSALGLKIAQIENDRPLKGSLAWFVVQLPDATDRTPVAVEAVMRKWSLPEAALWAALEEVQAGGNAIRNKAGLFVSKLDGYGKLGRYA